MGEANSGTQITAFISEKLATAGSVGSLVGFHARLVRADDVASVVALALAASLAATVLAAAALVGVVHLGYRVESDQSLPRGELVGDPLGNRQHAVHLPDSDALDEGVGDDFGVDLHVHNAVHGVGEVVWEG